MLKTIGIKEKTHRALYKDCAKYSGKKILTLDEIIVFHRRRSLAFERMIQRGEIHIKDKS